MEYQVELLNSTVKKLNISVDMDEGSNFQIETTHRASVFEPTDENDPTVMIRTECAMRDTTNKQLSIDMSVDCVFKFDPIPEDRTAAASQYCPPLINEALSQIAVKILHEMGHNFVIGT